MSSQPIILAISGVKNSGKTILIERVLPGLKEKGIKIAVIKHDGHDFEPDVPGTDSWRYREAGAWGCGVFSKSREMVIKEEPDIKAAALLAAFEEADLILLEGFKHSDWPKLEVIRCENSVHPVCPHETVKAYVADTAIDPCGKIIFGLNDVAEITRFIWEFYLKESQKETAE